ncbi:MAG: hypothetical protein Q8M86_07700 [Syntrophales bacterium]|nr:hypothetical protein [Syntrophales bacterium]
MKKGIILIDNASVYEDFFVRTTGECDDLKRVRKGIEERILCEGIGGAPLGIEREELYGTDSR